MKLCKAAETVSVTEPFYGRQQPSRNRDAAVPRVLPATIHLGFLASGILFAFVIAVPWVAYRLTHLNTVVAFWFAYIITRPLGASSAGYMGVPHYLGGLN